MIMEMTLTVVNSLAKNFENVKKGVDQIMGGNVIYTETRRNYEQGMSIGHAKGHTEGEDYLLIKTICSHMNRGKKLDQITDIFDMVEPEKIQRIYNLSLPFLPAYDVRQIYELLHEEDAV